MKENRLKKKLIILVLLALAGLVAYKVWLAPQRDGIAARYREHEVSWKQVEQLRSVLTLLGEKGAADDRTLVDRIPPSVGSPWSILNLTKSLII